MVPQKLGIAVVVLLALGALPAVAVATGHAVGSLTLDGKATPLAHAVRGSVENLFDEKKRDTLVVLSDRELGAIAPDDEIGLHLAAREGRLVALALRLDGGKLVNVSVHAAGLDGEIKLPGQWFTWKPGSGAGVGTLVLAKRDWDGHSYACSVELAAAAVAAGAAVVTKAPSAPARASTGSASSRPAPPEKLPPASTSSIEPKAMAKLLVAAMMQKDEDQAVKLIQSGADANLRDEYGIPMLSWSVMMCLPKTVKALVSKGASLKYERSPGLTILAEAGACPEAAKILRAAGAS